MDIVALFCDLDDFCGWFEPRWATRLLPSPGVHRQRPCGLALSELLTLLVAFHSSDYRTFKHFYLEQVCRYWRREFPQLPSYTRLVERIPSALVPLSAYLSSRLGQTRGIAFIDSLSVRVCHNRRIANHKVFAGLAERGKTSVDWFYGFKLHLIVNDNGDLLALRFTPGNVDDRAPVPALAEDLWGKLFGDRGYISQTLFEQLWEQGLQLMTKLRRNMKNKLMPMVDKLLLRKRTLIESIGEQLKHVCQIEHTRHRSASNGFVNMLAALVAYTWQERRPSLHLQPEERTLLLAACV
jgi:Transposase DDE domain